MTAAAAPPGITHREIGRYDVFTCPQKKKPGAFIFPCPWSSECVPADLRDGRLIIGNEKGAITKSDHEPGRNIDII